MCLGLCDAPAHRAFRKGGSKAVNIIILDSIWRDVTRNLNSLYFAHLDVFKAFNSVNHGVIVRVAAKMGEPDPSWLVYMQWDPGLLSWWADIYGACCKAKWPTLPFID